MILEEQVDVRAKWFGHALFEPGYKFAELRKLVPPHSKEPVTPGSLRTIRRLNWDHLRGRAALGDTWVVHRLLELGREIPEQEDRRHWLAIAERVQILESAQRGAIAEMALCFAKENAAQSTDDDDPLLWAALRLFGSLCSAALLDELAHFLVGETSRRTKLLALQILFHALAEDGSSGSRLREAHSAVSSLSHAYSRSAVEADPLLGALLVYRVVVLAGMGEIAEFEEAVRGIVQVEFEALKRRLLELLNELESIWVRTPVGAGRMQNVRSVVRRYVSSGLTPPDHS